MEKSLKNSFISRSFDCSWWGGYAAYRVYHMQKSYYPMEGEVMIVNRSESGGDHCIVVEEETGEQFTLLCRENDYNLVGVIDTVNCERKQSIITNKGEVYV